MPVLCLLECPPTPITRIASVSSFLNQTWLLLLFARDGCRNGWAHCTLHTSCSSTILFTVQFILMKNPRLGHCLIHSSSTHREKKYSTRSEKWILSYSSSRVQRLSLCVYLATSWHNDLIHLRKVHLETEMIRFGEIERCNISRLLELPVSVCLLVSMLQLMMTYESLT